MNRTRLVKTDQFAAVDEDDNRYIILEYTEFAVVRVPGGSQEIPGLKGYQLGHGEPVNKLSETEFEAVESGTKLRRL